MKQIMCSNSMKLLSVISIPLMFSCKPESPAPVKNLRKFINQNWQYTIRTNTKDSNDLIGMPRPYSTPSISGRFEEMYYWDTYFTNVGLISDGYIEQAINNVEDIIYLINKYGFMPNGNRTYYLYNTQPPYLSMMIRDVYKSKKNKEWLKNALPTLEKEYHFYMANRLTTIGLNRYSNQATPEKKLEAFGAIGGRLGKNFDPSIYKDDAARIKAGSHFYAEFESGWDLSPRFDSRCEDFCPVDLNCLLYMYEQNFAYFYKELGLSDASKWISLAKERKKLIIKYMYNPTDGMFYDYDFVNNNLSTILSAANFNVLWAKLADDKQAKQIIKGLPRLEFSHGVAACEPGKRKFTYQWDYPNGWANIQYLAIEGLRNYGYDGDAKRIAGKYVNMVSKNFVATGNLWEKYNIADGSINSTNEYGLPTLMGWTAGVFVHAADYLYK